MNSCGYCCAFNVLNFYRPNITSFSNIERKILEKNHNRHRGEYVSNHALYPTLAEISGLKRTSAINVSYLQDLQLENITHDEAGILKVLTDPSFEFAVMARSSHWIAINTYKEEGSPVKYYLLDSMQNSPVEISLERAKEELSRVLIREARNTASQVCFFTRPN